MAMLGLLRTAGARSLKSCMLGPQMLYRAPALYSASLLPKKTLMVSPVREKRLYGPIADLPAKTTHWKQERALIIGLLAAIPAGLIYPCAPLDYAIAASLTLHAHWGVTAIIMDYVHGELLPKIALNGLLVLSICTFAGLCLLTYNDIGVSNTIRGLMMV